MLSEVDVMAIRGCYVRGSTKEALADIWKVSLLDIERAIAGLGHVELLRSKEQPK